MRVIVAGSRDITDYRIVADAIAQSGFNVTEVVSGACPGVDGLGERWSTHALIRLARFPAEWSKHGRAAGPIRNAAMAEYADALVAVTNGSPGTEDMINKMRALGKPVYVREVDT